MGKYTEKDIVKGKKITKNGLLMGYVKVANNKLAYRIIKKVGAPSKTKQTTVHKRRTSKTPTSKKQASASRASTKSRKLRRVHRGGQPATQSEASPAEQSSKVARVRENTPKQDGVKRT